jgi:hypothetical protein
MALGGFIVNDATALGANGDAVAVAVDRLLVLTGFFLVMTLGVWHVFRKRGRIYI